MPAAGAVPGAAQERSGRSPGTGDDLALSPQAQARVADLRSRDTQVRAHEAAHVAAGGSLIRGGTSFTYEAGPDGRQYAVGGEVSIDMSAVPDDPRATLAKAEQIEAAALAPADPSPQDRSVAGAAQAMAAQASVQIGSRRGTGSILDVTA